MHCNYFVLFDQVEKGPWEIEFIYNGGGLERNKAPVPLPINRGILNYLVDSPSPIIENLYASAKIVDSASPRPLFSPKHTNFR